MIVSCARKKGQTVVNRREIFRAAAFHRQKDCLENLKGVFSASPLAERIRAAGAGIAGFFTPTGYGTDLAKGKETRRIDGRDYVLETPIHGDFALIKAYQGDRWGNLVFRKAARNFGPVMAMAARCTVAQVDEVVPLGALDPEHIITPGIFVHRVVAVGDTVMIGPAPGKGPKKP